MTSDRVPYAGIATRAVALVIDTVLSEGMFIVGAALLALIGSLVGDLRPEWLVPVLVSAGWVLTVGGYFVTCWAATGQTPGMRMMHVRVVGRDGAPPNLGRSVVRLVGLLLSIVPLFAGFLPILVDDRRRGLADFLAGTVVVYADREYVPAPAEARASLAAHDMTGQPS